MYQIFIYGPGVNHRFHEEFIYNVSCSIKIGFEKTDWKIKAVIGRHIVSTTRQTCS